MFRFTKRAFQNSPSFRRATCASVFASLGAAATTSAVAYAQHRVTGSDVATAVPALVTENLTSPVSREQAKIDAQNADRQIAIENGQQEDGQRQAYNPETGEIDWDCPCLGGMAHGPCGEEFKEAFSCFVHSSSEIRGSECIPKFSAMQDCFRRYPEVYAEFNEDTETVAEAERRGEFETAKDTAEKVSGAASSAAATVKNTAQDRAKTPQSSSAKTAAEGGAEHEKIGNSTRKKLSEAQFKTSEHLPSASDESNAKYAEAKDKASRKLIDAQSYSDSASEETRNAAQNKASNYISSASEESRTKFNEARKAANQKWNDAQMSFFSASDEGRAQFEKARKAADEKWNEAQSYLESVSDDSKAKYIEARNAANQIWTDLQHHLSSASESAKDVSSKRWSQAQENASSYMNEVEVKSSEYAEKLKSSQQDANDHIRSAAQDGKDRLDSAYEIASDLSAEYRAKLKGLGSDASASLSKYASDIQEATLQIVEGAKNKTETLDREQLLNMLETKLQKANDSARSMFETENNKNAFRQTQQVATDAIVGIAAEAKDAVNYVVDQISKK